MLEMKDNVSENISCKVITNKKNSGVHFYRIQGLLSSKEKYILFLDQDDQISPVYIREQLTGLGEEDMIVCKGKNRGTLIYRNTAELNRVKDIDEYKKEYNYIVSSAQVLIKRNSILQEWIENILHNNGAGDFFLWMLILLKKHNIQVQDKNLFWHVISDENTSSDTYIVDCSVLEMAQKMMQLGYKWCNAIIQEYTFQTVHDKKWSEAIDDYIKGCMKRDYIFSGDYSEYADEFIHLQKQIYDNTFISAELVNFVDQFKDIVIMGTGNYAAILAEQFLHNGIVYGGFVVSNKKEREDYYLEKSVWQLSELPYNRESTSIVIGINPVDWSDIKNSLVCANISNYYCPFLLNVHVRS